MLNRQRLVILDYNRVKRCKCLSRKEEKDANFIITIDNTLKNVNETWNGFAGEM